MNIERKALNGWEFDPTQCAEKLRTVKGLQEMYDILSEYETILTRSGESQSPNDLIADLGRIAIEISRNDEASYEKNAKVYATDITGNGDIYKTFLRIMRSESGKKLLPIE